MEIPIENFTLLADSNKGFDNAISKGRFYSGELYLSEIISITISLMSQYPDLEFISKETGLEYTDEDGILQRVDFILYCEYRDFFVELDLMIEDIIH